MITVSEILKKTVLRRYPVVCGERGLQNEVEKTGIIDYEFNIEGFVDTNKSFQKGDFLISSLMFTEGNEEKLLNMVIKLVELQVCGLAVKSVFFKELPSSVLTYCDEHGFPIIIFDNAVYFEEIISEVDDLLRTSDWVNISESKIGIMCRSDLSRYEVEDISKILHTDQAAFATVYWVRHKNGKSQFKVKSEVQAYYKSHGKINNCLLFKHGKDHIVIVLSDTKDRQASLNRYKQVLVHIEANCENLIVGESGIYHSKSELDYAIKEAYWSCCIGCILRTDFLNYEEAGTWGLLSAHYGSQHMKRYMESYLRPILNESTSGDTVLLDTLVEYVLCEGNLKMTAYKLSVHENTLRYRLGKLRERIDDQASDFIFFENVSMAVKIYLLNKMSSI